MKSGLFVARLINIIWLWIAILSLKFNFATLDYLQITKEQKKIFSKKSYQDASMTKVMEKNSSGNEKKILNPRYSRAFLKFSE